MIQATDHPGRSAQAIYMMWKAKIKPATFPKIPDTLVMADLQGFLNRWLFDTGYLNPQYYRATYERCEEINDDKAKTLLGEIFCN